MNEETMARVGPQRHREKKIIGIHMYALLFLIGWVFVVCYFIYFLLRFSVIPIAGFWPLYQDIDN